MAIVKEKIIPTENFKIALDKNLLASYREAVKKAKTLGLNVELRQDVERLLRKDIQAIEKAEQDAEKGRADLGAIHAST